MLDKIKAQLAALSKAELKVAEQILRRRRRPCTPA
nr:Glucose-6-phosphate 1-dehydrogenase [Candidatus Pantoea persica]